MPATALAAQTATPAEAAPQLVKLRLTPAVLGEMEGAIFDALAGKNPCDTDATYLKIHEALQKEGRTPKKGLVIEFDARDVAELHSRADYNVGREGVCQENLGWSTALEDRGYWLGRMRAYKALLAQIEALNLSGLKT